MPGEHCPLCGTVRAASGCACTSSHPDVTETAVLPHMEGPPLVRPYVPAAATGYGGAPSVPGQDPFGTALMPPVPPAPPQSPPAGAPVPPAPPQSFAVGPQQPFQLVGVPPVPGVPPQSVADGRRPGPQGGQDLGVFSFQGMPQQRPGGRAERRESEQLHAGRRRTVVIAAGLGIAAVGAGLALALVPSSDGGGPDQALPAPSGSIDVPPSTDAPAPTGDASASAKPRVSASGSRSKAPTSKAPVSVVSASGPAAPSPGPSSASPSASAPAVTRTLKPGDSGADVTSMQQLLLTVDCGDHHLNTWFLSGNFDSWTQWVLADFQRQHHIKGDERNGTLYGPQTRAALTAAGRGPGAGPPPAGTPPPPAAGAQPATPCRR
ncbi:peptidoglycan-binding domain-containing protein, partial [Kitasatospora sp. NPDC059571]|uniref:peptidoglycan-binding domain-containing protein n=1 Tax=Kitasatospora sp. NPDC059571 TaxID=3346871 RepID=UPI0036831403